LESNFIVSAAIINPFQRMKRVAAKREWPLQEKKSILEITTMIREKDNIVIQHKRDISNKHITL